MTGLPWWQTSIYYTYNSLHVHYKRECSVSHAVDIASKGCNVSSRVLDLYCILRHYSLATLKLGQLKDNHNTIAHLAIEAALSNYMNLDEVIWGALDIYLTDVVFVADILWLMRCRRRRDAVRTAQHRHWPGQMLHRPVRDRRLPWKVYYTILLKARSYRHNWTELAVCTVLNSSARFNLVAPSRLCKRLVTVF